MEKSMNLFKGGVCGLFPFRICLFTLGFRKGKVERRGFDYLSFVDCKTGKYHWNG